MPLLQKSIEHPNQSETAAAKRVQASLQLHFRVDESGRRTVLAHTRQEPPLRVVRAFTSADSSALVHLHNVSGGLLGGDHLHLEVRVGPRANAQITTTGATRIYRPRSSASDTTQTNEITVEEEALLEYVPDPLIPFAQVRYCQRTLIHLERGAGLFWWEVLAPGREAGGELFAYQRVDLKTEILADNRRIAVEGVRLEPAVRNLTSQARLGQYRYWASFYICRVGLQQGFWMSAEQQLRETAAELGGPNEMLWGISTLPAHGLALRCLGRHGQQMIPSLQKLWCAAKRLLYRREAVLPRKVN